MNNAYQQLSQNLQSGVASNQVQIKQLQTRLQVTMVNAMLFLEGGRELSRQGREELNKIGPALQGISGKQIETEGYTDNLTIAEPLARRFPSNTDLAPARTIQVVGYMEPQGIDPSQLSAVSFGRYHAIASNDAPASRTRNRRINIVIQDQTP
jgi:chemotaxis protein MotB